MKSWFERRSAKYPTEIAIAAEYELEKMLYSRNQNLFKHSDASKPTDIRCDRTS